MVAACKNFVIHGTEVELKLDTGADRTLISSRNCENSGRPTLDETARTLEAYVGHKIYFGGTSFCDMEWSNLLKATPGSCAIE